MTTITCSARSTRLLDDAPAPIEARSGGGAGRRAPRRWMVCTSSTVTSDVAGTCSSHPEFTGVPIARSTSCRARRSRASSRCLPRGLHEGARLIVFVAHWRARPCRRHAASQARAVAARRRGEEVFEADIAPPNVAQMQTRPARADRPEVDLRRLVAGFLRMAPDVAVVGEVRDREALSLLLAVLRGHRLHDDPCELGRPGPQPAAVPEPAVRSGEAPPIRGTEPLVSDAIDVVVHSARTREGVRITSVVAVEELVSGPDSPHFTLTEVFAPDGPGDRLQWTGELPERLQRRFAEARPRGADSPVGGG